MANLTPTETFDNVYQLETTDPVLGGAGGIANAQAQALTNRTEWLKAENAIIKSHNAQARTNSVLTGRYDPPTGNVNTLTIAAANTLRINADSTYPLIIAASAGYDENGEIVEIAKITTNLEFNTAALTNTSFLAVVTYQVGGMVDLFYCNEKQYYATPATPATPSVGNALWYNTATGISKMSDGGPWIEWRVVVVGRFVKSGGTISEVETFPYREPYHDEDTQTATIRTFAANREPRGGWLPCDGSPVSRTNYRKLYDNIGTLYGAGDGVNTFNVPDLRGRFIRGTDDGAGIDAARVFGSTQNDTFKAHNHTFTDYVGATRTQALTDTNGAGGGNLDIPISTGTGFSSNGTMNNTGDSETRPKNMALRFYIKY